ncbi:50S ribosomal protein L19e [Candidatus Woesearchaeota archaeon]|nr:50S ribosomal protein L19e [Candidatus Woesearchaeota archaeon]
MKLKIQKRLAAVILKCSKKRVVLDAGRADDMKEAITKADIRGLISTKAITKKPVRGISRVRARKRKIQRMKGRQKGFGSKKGKKTARLPKKRAWINKVRIQRRFVKNLRDKEVISKRDYQKIYMRIKGGFFRSKRHIKIYLEEQGLIENEK